MKTPLVLLVIATSVARGTEFEVKDGTSPDGRYVVRVVTEDSFDTGRFVIKDQKTGKTLETHTARGYTTATNDTALWNRAGTLVALGEKGTKTTYDTAVYVVAFGTATQFDLPDIVQNILGRRHAVTRGKNCAVMASRWIDDSTLALAVSVGFGADEPDPGGEGAEDYEVVIRFEYSSSWRDAHLKSIKPTEPPNGGAADPASTASNLERSGTTLKEMSDDQVVAIAQGVVKPGEIPAGLAPEITRKDDFTIVTWPVPRELHGKTPGPDYFLQVWVNRITGKTKVLGPP